MMSYTTSAAWSHHVFSPCCIEHGQRCGAVLGSYHHCSHVQERSVGSTLHC
jgi:hypothetical protein